MLFLSKIGKSFTLLLDFVNNFSFLFIKISATSYFVYFDICIKKASNFNFLVYVVFYSISFIKDFNIYSYLFDFCLRVNIYMHF